MNRENNPPMKTRTIKNAALLFGVLVLGCALFNVARADPDSPLPETGHPSGIANVRSMNGFTLKQFGDYVHNWHFVTVRFRHDSGEMRFVYANDIAWKALLAGSKDYPDGAVFAKSAVMTNDDPSFIDSAVPSGARREQFMVRNRKRFKDTDGWGYAVFDDQGRVSIGETQNKTSEACNACHLAVPDRGMIFSQVMPDLLDRAQILNSATRDLQKSHVPFVTVKVADLPEKSVYTCRLA